MVRITAYGGANEIGGNKILLEDGDARVFLDFGQSFSFGEGFFYDFLKPRKPNGLEVYFEFDLAPKIQGLYSRKMLEFTDIKYGKPTIDAVIISHGHSDHVGHISMIDETVPLFIGHGARRILSLYSELYPWLWDPGQHDDIREFASGKKFKIKHLEIEPVHVDHSIPGAYGFIIHTSKGAVVYTGDFRLHGPRSDMSAEFMKKAAEARPYALICEGTRMGNEAEPEFSEAEVEKRATEIIRACKGLALASFSMSNVDRFMDFYRAAKSAGRILVIETRHAHIIHHLREKIPVLPDVLTDDSIRIYYRMEESRTYVDADYAFWERRFMKKMITAAQISAEPQKYLMHMGFNRLMELVYLKPKDAEFIYSMSEHFYEGEENEEQKQVWENWMKHFNIRFHKLHSSGHISRKDLATFIKTVAPQILIPVHTNAAAEFKALHPDVRMPQKGEPLEI
jgi:ribonuclease J